MPLLTTLSREAAMRALRFSAGVHAGLSDETERAASDVRAAGPDMRAVPVGAPNAEALRTIAASRGDEAIDVCHGIAAIRACRAGGR